jgi:Undecaprenyl-phosphate glucose phosphotransferase
MRSDSIHHKRVVAPEVLERLGLGDNANAAPSGPRPARPPLVSARIIAALVRFGDGAIVALYGAMLWHLYVQGESSAEFFFYVPLMAGAAAGLPLLLQMGGLYSIHALLRPVEHVARLMAAWALIACIALAGLFLTKFGAEYSRLWVSLWFAGGLGLLVLFRMIVARLVRHWNAKGQLDRRAVLVGGGTPAGELIEALESSPDVDVSIAGIFDDRGDERSPPVVSGYRKLGNLSELIDFVRRDRVDLLIVTLPLTAENRLLDVLKRLWILPVDIRLSAYTQKLRYRPRAYSYIGNVPFLDVFDKPLTDWGQLLKAIEDKLIAGAALALLSPLFALVAIAIKLDSKGPVFFRQRRYGFNNELIEVYKFRSMYANASDATASRLVTRGDPRVTRIGRFLRKTSLDELPQLINVVKGELSLVGPRPHATHAKAQDKLYTDVVEGYFARHKVKPGITGWAQVNGWRGETDTIEKIHRRVEHDLYYIENWSIFFDLYVLVRTPFALFDTENAY